MFHHILSKLTLAIVSDPQNFGRYMEIHTQVAHYAVSMKRQHNHWIGHEHRDFMLFKIMVNLHFFLKKSIQSCFHCLCRYSCEKRFLTLHDAKVLYCESIAHGWIEAFRTFD